MKSLLSKRTVSLLLSFCLCFLCFAGIHAPVSASSNGKMFHVNGSNTTNLKIGFRNNTFDYADAKFVPGKQYRFSCKYKNTNANIGFRGSMFWFWYYNTSDSMVRINATSAGVTESYNSSNFLNTLTFTIPADCRSYNNAYIYFADYNGDLSGYEAYFADFRLENLTDGVEVPMFPEITSGNVYTSAQAANQKWRIPVGWNSKVTIEDIGSTFDPVTVSFNGGDMNVDGTTNILDLVRYKKVLAGITPSALSLDCDEDGSVGADDLILMVRILLNAGTPGYLQNTYCRLRYQKTLKVAYIGGSVTNGTGASSDETCWRALVTDYFKTQFPSATVTEYNMGIGGTGSYLGAARFQNNIIKNNPDLVFIEFAINDRYNGISAEQTRQDIEYMIRATNAANPYADIVIVLITDKTVFGTDFTALTAIKSVAKYYNLPIVNAGAAMFETLGGSTANWSSYYEDSVHPLDAGHQVYAEAVTDKMEDILINGGRTPHTLPVNKYCTNGFSTVTLLTRDTFEPFQWGTLDSDVYGANYWFDNTDYEISGTPFRTSNSKLSEIFPKYIYPQYDGATLEFTVTGNNIGLLANVKEDQSLTVTLDGNDTKTVTGSNRTQMTEYPLWNSLTNGQHTVRIVSHGDGPYIALAAVVVGS